MNDKLNEMLNNMVEHCKMVADTELLDMLFEFKEELIKNQKPASPMDDALEKAYPVKSNMRYKKNVGYFVLLDDGTEDGPYCPTCWELKNKLIHMGITLCKNWDVKGDYNQHEDCFLNKRYFNFYDCPNQNCRTTLLDFDLNSEEKIVMEEKRINFLKNKSTQSDK